MKTIPFKVLFTNECSGELETSLRSEPECLGIVREDIISSICDWRGFQPDDVLFGNIAEEMVEDFCL